MQILQGYEVEHRRVHMPAILHHHGWFDPQKAPMMTLISVHPIVKFGSTTTESLERNPIFLENLHCFEKVG
ncbi:hypothetical protein SDJN02_17230, partial [Cucurbita argyrosperma subsp. argyrosperma]